VAGQRRARRAAVGPGALRVLDGAAVPADGRIWIYLSRPDAIHSPNAAMIDAMSQRNLSNRFGAIRVELGGNLGAPARSG